MPVQTGEECLVCWTVSKMFALVENNKVVTVVASLPHNWKNVSGLHLSHNNEAFLKTLGWYKVTLPPASAPQGKTHTGYTYSWTGTQVVAQPVYQSPPQPDREEFLRNLRAVRNELLRVSDWTQQPDLGRSVQWVNSWKVYRKALRDLPATTQATRMDQVVYPTPPAV